MFRTTLTWFLALLASLTLVAQESSNPITQALSQGDLYSSKRKYELALDAYHKADKLSHHSSAPCYLKIASVERKLGEHTSLTRSCEVALKAVCRLHAVGLLLRKQP